MNKILMFALILVLTVASSPAQEALPFSKDAILVFIEPFQDGGPDDSQAWLEKGLPGFITSALGEEEDLYPYLIHDFHEGLLDRPHRLQDLIWKSVFKKQVDPDYETYMLLGDFSYLDGQVTIYMQLLTLKNTQVIARFQKTMPYTDLLGWKSELGAWVLSQMRLGPNTSSSSDRKQVVSDGVTPMPGVPFKEQLTDIFNLKQKKETEDLQRKYEKQSMMKLGTQLEQLWYDIAYDPYLARIQDVHTLRLQHEPDSVLVNFKVSYRINPRILDEIEHFSKTRAGLVEKTETFEQHAFMDLGYIDAAFTEQIAGGDWRIVPIITMGPESLPERRTFYHSFPRPIEPPGENYINKGEFKQLLVAIPGVNSMRIFAQERQQVYEYEIVVGVDEIKRLGKIQVKFVAEEELTKKL
ncbi:MAG: hypothetical protein K9M49_02320 [Candidatus Marinimicrobia bacterium]|nr:hypothetical protein [Candidatus Neomarinimicrobiota bacterium]MCF7850520.1 hypothetical protein [Candidatus Neomarinimicrobiota bacterium]MCF7903967.1 hypothetical protein [Candidatus Neomarinimicrobiota bacterium]